MSNIMSSLKLLFCVVVNTAMVIMVWGMGGRVGRGLGVFLSVAMAVMVKRGFRAFRGKGGEGKSESASENENCWGGKEM